MPTALVLAIAALAAAAKPPPGELLIALPGGGLSSIEVSDLEAAARTALGERDKQVFVAEALRGVLDAQTLKDLRACKDVACAAEFAGGLALPWLWVVQAIEHGGQRFIQLARATGGAGQVLSSGKAGWPADGSQLAQTAGQAADMCLGLAPTVTVLEPPASDLRGRIKYLAQRLSAAYARSSGDAGIKRVAVMSFDTIGGEGQTKQLGSVVAETLVTDLSGLPGVTVVERAKLEGIVKELKLQQTAEIDARTATEIGKFVGAGSMVVGSVAEAGAQYVINARQVSVETAAVIQAESVTVDRAELVALSEQMVEIKSATGAALRSAVIPGWGQIYNGDGGTGALFMGAAALAAATGGACGALYIINANRYHENTPETVANREQGNRFALAANIAAGAYALIWVSNIVHAWLTGTDATLINPPETSVGLAAAPTPLGGGLLVSVNLAR